MDCPFCGKEMKSGILSGDGRSKVRWKEGEKKSNVWDKLSLTGGLTGVKYTLSSFTIPAYFCPDCKKMIFDTDVEK
jgi:hypothetical protein